MTGDLKLEPNIPGDDDLDEERMVEIGKRLRKSFQDIVEEPIPDDYKKLLDELERTERLKK